MSFAVGRVYRTVKKVGDMIWKRAALASTKDQLSFYMSLLFPPLYKKIQANSATNGLPWQLAVAQKPLPLLSQSPVFLLLVERKNDRDLFHGST